MGKTEFPQGLRSAEGLQSLVSACGDGCAFLRHDRDCLQRRETSDWDIAVKDASEIGQIVEELFGPPVIKIERLYVIQRFYPWGQLDLLPAFLVNGCRYLDDFEFWQSVVKGDDGISRPSLAHDAFLAWMTGVLTGGRYNDRYDDFIQMAFEKDASAFRRCLDSSFGKSWGKIVWEWAKERTPCEAAKHFKELRRAAAFQHGCDEPGGLVWSVLRHWTCELRHHIKPPMPLIAFLGPDGSGKTSVIEGVQAGLTSMRVHTKLQHWRPNSFSKQQGDGAPVTDPHGKPPRGLLASVAKLGLFLADWWYAYLGPLLHARAKVTTVISDRYYHDLLVDPRRYRFGAPLWMARAAFKLMPRPDLVIVLAGDPEVIHARKQEVTLEELRRQMDGYRALGESLGEQAVIVDAGAALESVISGAMNAVLETLKKRRSR